MRCCWYFRGLTRKATIDIGKFWVDLTRSILYVLLPFSVIFAFLLVAEGTVQTFNDAAVVKTIEACEQTIPLGPVASQIAVERLGKNGGGFFNTNSAHPYENPIPLSNCPELLAILLIPAALPFAYGRMLNGS